MASALEAEPVPPSHHLVWKRTDVGGRPALYGVAGEGLPVVFLHGWALGQHAYKRSLKRLVAMGCEVFAPAMPGFGGSADLPGHEFSLAGYARWVDQFLSAVGVDEPVFVIGHSFGGGVAIQFAHDFPERIRTLVLVNSVGGSVWAKHGSSVRSMAERPIWDWGIHFPADILPLPQLTRVLPVVLEDAVPNILRNPRTVVRAANLARKADLTTQLEELKARKVPVLVLWGEHDRIIPRDSFDALCAAVGSDGEVVAGNHSWLLADPDSFGEVMTNMVSVAQLARAEEAKKARRRRVLRRIGAKSTPREVPKLTGGGARRSGGRRASG